MVRPHAAILELETQHRGDIEANLVAVTLKIAVYATEPLSELMADLLVHRVAADADPGSDQDIEILRPGTVGRAHRLDGLGPDARKRPAPASMSGSHRAKVGVEKEDREAVGMVRDDRLAWNIGRQRIRRKNALAALRLPSLEGGDVGAMLLHRHQGAIDLEADLRGELLATSHHRLRIA